MIYPGSVCQYVIHPIGSEQSHLDSLSILCAFWGEMERLDILDMNKLRGKVLTNSSVEHDAAFYLYSHMYSDKRDLTLKCRTFLVLYNYCNLRVESWGYITLPLTITLIMTLTLKIYKLSINRISSIPLYRWHGNSVLVTDWTACLHVWVCLGGQQFNCPLVPFGLGLSFWIYLGRFSTILFWVESKILVLWRPLMYLQATFNVGSTKCF